MRLQQIPAAAPNRNLRNRRGFCLSPPNGACSALSSHDRRPTRERAPGPGSASCSPCDGTTLISDVAFTIKQYVQTRVEADRQVAIILVS